MRLVKTHLKQVLWAYISSYRVTIHDPDPLCVCEGMRDSNRGWHVLTFLFACQFWSTSVNCPIYTTGTVVNVISFIGFSYTEFISGAVNEVWRKLGKRRRILQSVELVHYCMLTLALV